MPSGSEDEDEEEDEDARSDISPKSPTRDLESDSEGGSEVEPAPVPLESKSRKKAPAWVDPDDLDVQASLASNKRLRKLRDTVAEDGIGGRNHERRLRRQFEKLNPTPKFTSTGGILEGKRRKSKILSPKTISIERLKDANLSARAEGELGAVQFHPSPQVPMLLAASADRRLRLSNMRIYTPLGDFGAD